jgi:hypothetical protein
VMEGCTLHMLAKEAITRGLRLHELVWARTRSALMLMQHLDPSAWRIITTTYGLKFATALVEGAGHSFGRAFSKG